MSNQPIRAGVIGLGVGRNHAKAYRESPDSRLVALCDANEIRLNEMADELNVPSEGRYTDYTDMLAKANLDLVSVCLPNALHPVAAIAALQAGVHVLCEKPMASAIAEAQQMLDAAESNQRRLMVSYNYRYRPDSQWMYHMVQTGKLGQIHHVNATWRREIGIPGWGLFGSKAMSGGGALIDLGVHVLDLALWMMDFPAVKTVSGQARTLFAKDSQKTWGRTKGQTWDSFDVDDGAVGFLRLANGASMVLQATWAEHTEPQEDRVRVELQGTEGTVVFDMGNYTKEDTLRYYTEIEDEPVTVIPKVRWGKVWGHQGLVYDAIAVVMGSDGNPPDGQQGLVAVQVLEALYQSSELGREVALEPVLSQ